MLCILNPSRTHQILVSYIVKCAYEYGKREAFMRPRYLLQYDPHYSILFFIHGAVEIVYKLFFSKIEHSFGTPVKCFRYTTALFYTLYEVTMWIWYVIRFATSWYILYEINIYSDMQFDSFDLLLEHFISLLLFFLSFSLYTRLFFCCNQVVRISIYFPLLSYFSVFFFEGITARTDSLSFWRLFAQTVRHWCDLYFYKLFMPEGVSLIDKKNIVSFSTDCLFWFSILKKKISRHTIISQKLAKMEMWRKSIY